MPEETSFTIERRRIEGFKIDILTIKGALKSDEALQLQAEVERSFNEGIYCLILDFTGVRTITTPGFRALMDARKRTNVWKEANNSPGGVRIINMTRGVKEIFGLTNYTEWFPPYGNIVDALASF